MKNILNVTFQKFPSGKFERLAFRRFFQRLFLYLLAPAWGLIGFSCDYLDIVPDNVLQYEDLFTSQRQAYNALATCYAGLLGNVDERDYGEAPLGDDWIATNPSLDTHRNWVQGSAIMRGQQGASDPLMDYWTSTNYPVSYYTYIRHCDLFIRNVDRVLEMSVEDKADWKGQAMFLKAYYTFKLMQEFGPVVLPVSVEPDAPDSEMFPPRSKVEDCFAFIIDLLNQAIPLLKERAGTKEFGQADKVIALTFKAQVLLFRASPFYNGNSEYYADFLDHDGQPFFSVTYDPEKWKATIDATDAAIEICQRNGIQLFTYKGEPYKFDTADYNLNRVRLKQIYDLRFRIVDPTWNTELIWGEIDASTTTWRNASTISDVALLYKPNGYGGPSDVNQGSAWMGASLQSTMRYYTSRGLLLEEDRMVNENTLYDVVNTPNATSTEYDGWQGILQPGVPTVRMYLDREPRFYNDLVITGGYLRGHQVRINTMMFAGSDGGYLTSFGTSFNITGIAVQKICHPESLNSHNNFSRRVVYPQPYLRYADLLLMKAEAMNEYYGPSQEVYDLVNMVRLRAGIPTVEESYSNPEWVRDEALNKHLTKEGMREIIHSERGNEFAYERGNSFWDMIRWKKAVTRYSNPIWGWNYLGANAYNFFEQNIVQGRKWSVTDCLWPIKTSELDANSNLIQNPGW